MNFFTLFAHGEHFDVDAFLASTSLKPDDVWRCGDRKKYCPPEIDSRHPTNGVEFVLGDGRRIPFLDQDDIAIEYLRTHRSALRSLAQFPNLETYILMFHYEREFCGDDIGGCVGPSPLLMSLALDIGVRLEYTFILRRTPIEATDDEDPEPSVTPDRPPS